MACDVRIERLDKSEAEDDLLINARDEDTLDELMVTVTEKCLISPTTRTLFAFKQVMMTI